MKPDEILKDLRAIAGHVLHLSPDQVPVDATFLSLGADSLILVEIIRGVSERFQVRFTVRELFEETPTLESVAARLARETPVDPSPASQPVPPPQSPPAKKILPPSNASALEQLISRQLEAFLEMTASQLQALSVREAEPSPPNPLSRKRERGNQNSDSTLSRLRERGGGGVRAAEDHIPTPFPLTEGQRQLYTLSRMSDDGSAAYNESLWLRLRGDVRSDALEAAWRRLVRRHEGLRTSVPEDGETQNVAATEELDRIVLPRIDLRGLDLPPELDPRRLPPGVDRLVRKFLDRLFVLDRAPLWRVALLHANEDEHHLILVGHHLVLDGMSASVLAEEWIKLYDAAVHTHPARLPAAMPFRRFAAYLDDERRAREADDEAYWLGLFADGAPSFEPPVDRPRTTRRGFLGDRLLRRMSAQTAAEVAAFGRKHEASLFMVALAAWATVLHRWCDQDDVLIGIPFAHRPLDGEEHVVGHRVDLLPVRSRGARTFAERLNVLRRGLLDAQEHSVYSFAGLVRALDLRPEPGRGTLLHVSMNLDQNPSLVARDLDVAVRTMDVRRVKFELALHLLRTASGSRAEPPVDVCLELRRDLFDRTTGERLLHRVIGLMENLARRPEQAQKALVDLPVLARHERHHLLIEQNDVRRDFPADVSLSDLFEAQVRRRPDAVAVEWGPRSVSYGLLAARADRIATCLRGLGIGPERVVAVYAKRSPEAIVALLAVIRARGVYMALDPDFPSARIAFQLADAAAAAMLVEDDLMPEIRDLPVQEAVPILRLDGSGAVPKIEPTKAAPPTDGLSGAYVVYTSGSTGRPKGAFVSQRAVARLVFGPEYVSLSAADVYPQISNLAFDASTFEVWAALLRGAKLVGFDRGTVLDPDRLAEDLAARRITAAFVTTAVFQQALDARPDVFDSLREVIFGGEAVDSSRLHAVLERLDRRDIRRRPRLSNIYGPSECTTFALSYPLNRSQSAPDLAAPIGRPIANTPAYVVDRRLRLLPWGSIGELVLGGPGVVRGYHGRPALTAERFVPDPFSDDASSPARLYRTGDRARRRSDGAIDFLGRFDFQVKIRGHRVELPEIEIILRRDERIRDAVVLLDRDDARAEDARLAAFLIARDPSRPPSANALRERLASELPGFMVPKLYLFVDEFPITRNRKTDRNALLALARERTEHASAQARSKSLDEKRLAEIWKNLLGVEHVAPEDSFFDLGGHSLMAVRTISRIREAFGTEISIEDFFLHPVLADQARLIDDDVPQETSIPAATSPAAPAPLSPAQERLYFLDRLLPNLAIYNIPYGYALRGPLDVRRWRIAVRGAARRHDVLRSRFLRVDDEKAVVETSPHLPTTPLVDLTRLAPVRAAREARRTADREARRPFDLAREVFRAPLLRITPGDHLALLLVHHIVFDGLSIDLLARELRDRYRGASPAPPTIRYADYALRQHRRLADGLLADGLQDLREHLDDFPRRLDLPLDHPRPAAASTRGRIRRASLPAHLVEPLHEFSKRRGATLFMTLLSAFQILLARLTQQDRLLVSSPVAGRDHRQTEDLLGFFVNNIVLRARLGGDPSLDEALDRTREDALFSFARREIPFEKLVEALEEERDLSRAPLCQAWFALQDAPDGPAPLDEDVDMSFFVLATYTSKIDLSLAIEQSAEPAADALQAIWEYSTDLFDEVSIRRFHDAYVSILEALTNTPQTPISRVPLLPPATRHQMLHEWNDTARPGLPAESVPERLHRRSAAIPDRIALAWDGGALSYGALRARTRRRAAVLVEHGVGPEISVGLYLERSPEALISLAAILQAGGVYVPLGLDDPPRRIAQMTTSAQVTLVLTRRELVEQAAERLSDDIRLICVEDLRPREREIRPLLQPRIVDPRQAAYLLYTSGSTGEPKGVCVPHDRILRLVLEQNYADLDQKQVFLQFAPLTFDASTLEIWAAWLHGARLEIAPAGALSLSDLGLLLRRRRVSTLWLTAGLFHQMVDEQGKDLVDLEQLLAGGDALSLPHVRRAAELLPRGRVINGYGPTECTTFSVCYPWPIPNNVARPSDSPGAPLRGAGACLSAGESARPCERSAGAVRRPPTSVPIGRPLAQSGAFVVDRRFELSPIGVAGFLICTGRGVSRGYHGRGAATAEAFVPDPFTREHGARAYRTGDLARLLHDGAVEFLGRADRQVKVRGFRIEPGEIENLLLEEERLREAVVVAREQRLIAYVVPVDLNDAPTAQELRERLLQALPPYAVPSLWKTLDALPLTANGKLDRRALPDATESASETEEALQGPTQQRLAEIWQDVLGVERVGPNNDFFRLGGHSLLATRVISQIGKIFDAELPLRALFEAPTVASLASKIDESKLDERREASLPTIKARGERPPQGLPLSYAQRRLWFLAQLEPELLTAYNVPLALRVRGALDVGALSRVLTEILHRHEALRTVFPQTGDEPRQVVRPAETITLEPIAGKDPQEALHAEANRDFDLLAGPLFRAELLRVDEEEHVLLLSLHHIVCDGWSMDVLVRELTALYLQKDLEPPPIQYGDFTLWQIEELGDVFAQQSAYWREALAAAPETIELPVDRPRPARLDPRAGRSVRKITPEIVDAVQGVSRTVDATPFMVCFAAFAQLLSRWSGGDDLPIATAAAGRNRAETESLIGFFVNTLILRARPGEAAKSRDFVEQVRTVCLDAWAHQDLPFERLVEDLRPSRESGENPFTQVLFTLQDATLPSFRIGDLEWESIPAHLEHAKFDLSLGVIRDGDGWSLEIEYRARLFDASTVQRLARDYETLLRAFLDLDASLVDLTVFDRATRHQMLIEWNETGAARQEAPAATLPELFARQVRKTPDALVLDFDEGSLSYAALARRTERLSRQLRGAGVGVDEPVGLLLERSPRWLVGLSAIVDAGAAYVPLDPGYPDERLAWMLEDTQLRVLLTESALEERARGLAAEHPVKALSLDVHGRCDAPLPDFVAAPLRDPSQLAYVIYTSGSTGRPKGIRIPHHAIERLVIDPDYTSFEPNDRIAQISNASFDAATYEIWGALLNGGCLVGLPKESALEPALFVRELSSRRVRQMFITAALFNQTAELAPDGFAGLREVMTGGEAADPHSMARILEHGAPDRLTNAYGPTENTTFSSYFPVRSVPEGATNLPIGGPIRRSTSHVVDRRLRLVPTGAAGELIVGGPGLARDYLRRPALTAEKFVPDPFSGDLGVRLYRTGDLARRRGDGKIEFLGRFDHQVKVRGFRIELGEIDAAVMQHPDVRAALTTIRRDSARGGDQRLICWFSAAPEADPGTSLRVRERLTRKLPDYMVPSLFIEIEEMPLTPNGKIDRKALAARELPSMPDASPLSGTPEEEMLSSIWADVLDRSSIDIDEDFFEIGGHSLLAARVVSRVRNTFGVELPLRALFETPTVRALANRLAQHRGSDLPPIAIRGERPAEGLPLSYAQRRLWFLAQLEPELSAAYNVPLGLRIRGPLDVAALNCALTEILRRHEALRTVFPLIDDEPRQIVEPAENVELVIETGDPLLAAREEASREFDLEKGPLMRTRLLRQSDDEHVLLLSLHHIVCDGWSMDVLVRELTALYLQEDLEPLAVQYGDFALWQIEELGDVFARQSASWRETLAGAPETIDLPVDHPRPARIDPNAAWRVRTLAPEIIDEIRSLSRTASATPFMVCLAAFAQLLSRWSGARDLPIATAVANRGRAEIEPLIGFFVNTLILRARPEEAPTSRDLIQQVRTVSLDAWARQDLPFERLLEDLRPSRESGENPFTQIFFTLQDDTLPNFRIGELELEPIPATLDRAKFDLGLGVIRGDDGWSTAIEYRDRLFDASTIERLGRGYETLLRAFVDLDAPLADLPIFDRATRHQMLIEWNETGAAKREAPNATPAEIFARRAAETPDALAVAFDAGSISYAELARRAGRLGRRLRAMGANCDQPVGLMLSRSPRLMTCKLAILDAGAAYAALDPSYPDARLDWMLKDTALSILLTEPALEERARVLAGSEVRVLTLDDRGRLDGSFPEPLDDAAPFRDPSQIAYVVYTSGSTGRPKGIRVPHRSVERLTVDSNYVRVLPGDRIPLISNISFDAAVLEIWNALLNGACLIDIPEQSVLDPVLFARENAMRRVSVMHVTTALLNQTAELAPDAFANVRELLSGGEAIDPNSIARILEYGPPDRLKHTYGPSENSTLSSHFTVRRVPAGAANLPIGGPLRRTTLHVTDRRLRLVPTGAAGELVVGGEGLARDYLRRRKLTAENFIPDPFSGDRGARLYRTGDLVRRRGDGMVEFLGRFDHQVKIRGFRVELGEIDATVAHHPEAAASMTVARRDPDGKRGGELRLACWFTTTEDAAPDAAVRIREMLIEKLPSYMVPTFLIEIEEMPLTPNGKVDRRALETRDLPAENLVAEEDENSPIEETLALIWADVLDRSSVGLDENFFDLGGHSLLAARMAARITRSFGVETPLRELFEAPTVRALTARVEARLAGDAIVLPPLLPAARESLTPTSFSQERLWFLDRLDPGDTTLNMPVAFRLCGPLRIDLLRDAAAEIVRRHETLRTVFEDVDGASAQRIVDESLFAFSVRDLADEDLKSPQDLQSEIDREIAEHALAPFDLADGPLLDVRLLRLADDEHVFLLNLHHIISDGLSIHVFYRELAEFYRAALEERMPDLPELPVQYADFAVWQRGWLQGEILEQQIGWWRERLADAPITELPSDRPRPAEQTHKGALVGRTLSAESTARLDELPREHGATLFTILLAAFKVLLARCLGERDLSVGTPTAGRRRREVEDLIGFFLNTLVLRTDLNASDDEPLTFARAVERVRESVLGAFSHQDVPFEKILAELSPERDLSRTPFFQIFFNMIEAELDWDLPEIEAEVINFTDVPSKFDLTVYVGRDGERLTLNWLYNADLYDRETMVERLDQYVLLLEQIAEDPHREIDAYSLITPRAKQILPDPSASLDATWRGGVPDLFFRRADERPEALAVADGRGSLTYVETAALTRWFASRLRELGVQRGDVVAILAQRDAALLWAVLGVLEAGAVFTLFDPAYPPKRLAATVDQARPKVWLTLRASAPKPPPELAQALDRNEVVREVLPEREAWNALLAAAPAERAAPDLGPDDPACLTFTSGSTGLPKGILGRHGSLTHFTPWMIETYEFDENDRWSLLSGLAHDPLQRDLLTPMQIGASLIVPDETRLLEAGYLARWTAEKNIAVANLTPAMAQVLSEALTSADQTDEPLLPNLRLVFLVGDVLTWRDVRRLREMAPNVECVNHYGSTETSRAVGFHRVRPTDETPEHDRALPLGRGVPGVQLLIKTRTGDLAGLGEIGEISVRSPHLSLGYFSQGGFSAEETEYRFRDAAGVREYRTGDLGRCSPDGEVRFAGRVDQQVKIRGFRIELGEIESALTAGDDVRDAVALLRRPDAGEGESVLAAWVAPARGAAADLDLEALRRRLTRNLPRFMVPTSLEALDSLPLTANGKIDRRALERRALKVRRAAFTPPGDALERHLAGVWRELLGLEQVSVDDAFFDVGGHSLLLVQLHGRLRRELGADLTLMDLFNAPTVRDLAQRLRDGAEKQDLSRAQDRGRRQAQALRRRRQRRPKT